MYILRICSPAQREWFLIFVYTIFLPVSSSLISVSTWNLFFNGVGDVFIIEVTMATTCIQALLGHEGLGLIPAGIGRGRVRLGLNDSQTVWETAISKMELLCQMLLVVKCKNNNAAPQPQVPFFTWLFLSEFPSQISEKCQSWVLC